MASLLRKKNVKPGRAIQREFLNHAVVNVSPGKEGDI